MAASPKRRRPSKRRPPRFPSDKTLRRLAADVGGVEELKRRMLSRIDAATAKSKRGRKSSEIDNNFLLDLAMMCRIAEAQTGRSWHVTIRMLVAACRKSVPTIFGRGSEQSIVARLYRKATAVRFSDCLPVDCRYELPGTLLRPLRFD